MLLSVCMIIKNEEKHLRQCLDSIKDIADEIIIVDTGSSDASRVVAGEFSTRIYSCRFRHNFSAARNFGLAKAKGKWILVIDGDEELDGNCTESIRTLINNCDSQAFLIRIKHILKINHELLEPDLQLRLFRNNPKFRYNGVICEQIEASILADNPEARIETARDLQINHFGFLPEAINRQRLKRNVDLINDNLTLAEDDKLKHFYLGRQYYRHQQFEKALQHFSRCYPDPDFQERCLPELLYSMAVSLHLLNRTPDATDLIDGVLAALPDMVDLHYLKAVILKDKFAYLESYRSFDKFLQNVSFSDLYPSHNYKIHFYMGSLAEYFMNKEDALRHYLQSLQLNPYMLDSLRRIIAILNPRVNLRYTIESLNKILDWTDDRARMEMAVIFYEEGAYELSLACLNALEETGFSADRVRLLKGLVLLRSKRYSEAENKFREIVNSSHGLEARQHLCLYFWIIRDYRRSMQYLNELVDLQADTGCIHVLRLLLKVGDNKTVVKAYSEAKAIMEIILEIGDAEQINEAFQNLSSHLGTRPSYLLAEMLYRYGRWDLAEEELNALLEIEQIDNTVLYYLGKTCWALGELRRAEKYLAEAVANGLNTPKIRWEMARLYQELAIMSFRTGLEECPDNEEQNRVLDKMMEVLVEV